MAGSVSTLQLLGKVQNKIRVFSIEVIEPLNVKKYLLAYFYYIKKYTKPNLGTELILGVLVTSSSTPYLLIKRYV